MTSELPIVRSDRDDTVSLRFSPSLRDGLDAVVVLTYTTAQIMDLIRDLDDAVAKSRAVALCDSMGGT